MISKVIVIDTSIFQSAGNSDNPESSRSRDILEAIYKICHNVGFTKYLSDEWKRHRSRYSSSWLALMTGRKKVVRLKNEEVFNQELREKISKLNFSESDTNAIDKDIPLIEAAIATDNTIISKDDRMREILSNISIKVGILKKIMWVNPIRDDQKNLIKWLSNGANLEEYRCLGS